MHLRKTHIATLVVGVAIVAGTVMTLARRDQTTTQADVPVGTASLAVESKTVKVGEETTVSVLLNTGTDANNNQTSGVDVVLAYDPAILEVVDTDAQTAGSQVSVGKVFDFVPANKVNATLGQISFSASQQPTNQPVRAANQVIATIRFNAKAAGRSPLRFGFTAGDLSDSNVIKADDGRDLLNRVQDGVVTVSE